MQKVPKDTVLYWPNRVSVEMGDKAFGLLMANLRGLRVPKTTVIGRSFPMCTFGTSPAYRERLWLRTCPLKETPGKYPTCWGWNDPFRLMQEADPLHTEIASLLIQEGVQAVYAGAAITDADGNAVVEGKSGLGDVFMVGEQGPEILPQIVVDAVKDFYRQACSIFGPVRFEWVFDGKDVWCVQLHLGVSLSRGRTIYPGEAANWKEFQVVSGIEALRALAQEAERENFGIVLRGNVGVTGHFAEILCKSKVPSRVEP